MQTIHYLILGAGVWLLLGSLAWAIIHGGTKSAHDNLEDAHGYVDQDGEAVYPAISWRNASVKVPHADASAATFHRAGD